MNLLLYLLLLLVLPLAIVQYISSWERDGHHSNSLWGLAGWLIGALTAGLILSPFLWLFAWSVALFYLFYTSLWGLATAKLVNGLSVKTTWYVSGVNKALIGLVVGLFVGASLSLIGSYLNQFPPNGFEQVGLFIIGMASGVGAGVMSKPFDVRPYA